MACNPLIIWSPIPAGSRFIPRTRGDESAYNVTVFITHNDHEETPLSHDEVAGGTAEVAFAAGDSFVFDVEITMVHEPAQNITLDLRVVDENDQVVSVDDGTGGQRPASCSSAFDDPSQSPITIKVVALV